MGELRANSDSHDIEHTLRAQWRREVGEVAVWMPDAWQPAVLWWSTWTDLPVLEYLARGEPLLPWMARDAVYRSLRSTSVSAEDTGDAGRLTPALRELMTHPGSLLLRWCEAWRTRMPPGQSSTPFLLELYRTLDRHLASFAAQAAGDGWPLRRALERRLAVLFRKALLEPAAAFVYLALTALDLERLRAELVQRAIFTRQFTIRAAR
jgi:hypothetical protein